jgi:predicted Zn finger-like uncharacterized protein
MSIRVRCPKCDASFRADDEDAGKTVRCAECGERVEVADGDEAPRRKPKKKQKSNLLTILLIVGGALAFSCLVCGGGSALVAWLAWDPIQNAIVNLDAALPPGNGPVLLTQHGRLMPNDPIRDGRIHRAFQVPLQQGKTYVIDMRSRDMDSFLCLYDPGGILVASDDDSAGHLDARIIHRANRTGNYTIAATALGNAIPFGGGNFTVIAREQ